MTTCHKKIILFFSYVFFFACSLFAANYYWIGGASGNWSDGNNWSTSSGGSACGTYPSISSDVVYFDARSGTCTVDLTSDVVIDNLNIQNDTATVTVNLNGYSVTGNHLYLGTASSSLGGLITGGISANLAFNGQGNAVFRELDPSEYKNNTLTLVNNVDLVVTEKIWADAKSGYTTTITGDSTCSVTTPASYSIGS